MIFLTNPPFHGTMQGITHNPPKEPILRIQSFNSTFIYRGVNIYFETECTIEDDQYLTYVDVKDYSYLEYSGMQTLTEKEIISAIIKHVGDCEDSILCYEHEAVNV